MTAQMSLVDGPVTFTASGGQYYYGGEDNVADVNGTIYIALPFSDGGGGGRGPPQDRPAVPLTYTGYSFNSSGAFSFNDASTIDSWFNAFNPQNKPPAYLESVLKPFGGSNSQSDFAEYFETLNTMALQPMTSRSWIPPGPHPR